MYVPVLHARRSEKAAVGKLPGIISGDGLIRPIFIPIRDGSKAKQNGRGAVVEVVRFLSKAKIPYILLTTPYDTKINYGQKLILKILKDDDKNNCVTPAIAVTKAKPISTLESEIEALEDSEFVVLHQAEPEVPSDVFDVLKNYKDKIQFHAFYVPGCKVTYMDKWKSSKRVVIEDGFKKQAKNENYSATPDETYSDLVFRFDEEGFDGFGDHTIIGEEYKPGGGIADYVTLHLTYPSKLKSNSYTSVGIRHFVSDTSTGRRQALVKSVFTNALAKLVAFYKAYPKDFAFSKACKEYADPSTNFAGPLPKAKILSIQHHIELMNHLNPLNLI